jgi:hypothetical protein
MTSHEPRVNESGFVAVQHDRVVAIVPDGNLDESMTALADIGVDLAWVEVLQGDIGARTLDFDGTKHGLWAHVVRTTQKLGTASNERENYAAALRSGDSVVIVPVHTDAVADVYARVLDEHGCRRIIHFRKYTTEQLSF